MTPQETFVTRLRRHRQRHRITIEEIAAETNVKPELIVALEKNDLSTWPRGLYARSLIRAYASTVGLDPIDTVDEFCRLFPQGDRRVQPTIEEMAHIVAQPSEYRQEIDPEQDRRRTPEINMLSRQPWPAALAASAVSMLRTARTRAAALVPAPYARAKRQPRTSS